MAAQARRAPTWRARLRDARAQERRFALALLVPALAVLRADDDGAARLSRAGTACTGIDLGMPWLSGFAGARQLREDGQRPALLEFARADRRSTPRRRSCCRSSIGLVARAARAADSEGPGRAARRRDPADRARAGRRRPVLAHAGARARLRPGRHGHARARPRQPQLARRPAARADLGDRDPHLAVDAVRLPRAARDARRRCRPTSTRRRGSTAPAPGSASSTSRCR